MYLQGKLICSRIGLQLLICENKWQMHISSREQRIMPAIGTLGVWIVQFQFPRTQPSRRLWSGCIALRTWTENRWYCNDRLLCTTVDDRISLKDSERHRECIKWVNKFNSNWVLYSKNWQCTALKMSTHTRFIHRPLSTTPHDSPPVTIVSGFVF